MLHTRLAIVDPDDRARQPFTDGGSRVTVTFNGEIYNYAELRRELDGYPFRTSSDTEVLIAAFLRWGIEGFKRLRGMFSCALVDERAQRVYLVRDPVGKKPLFVASWAGGLWFGSSVLAFVATSRVRPFIRTESLEAFWALTYIPPNDSILRDCSPVAPGEVLVFDFNGKSQGRWSCRPASAQETMLPKQEALSRLDVLIRQSVIRRLHNNPHPVSLLSGGIDSTVITKCMAKSGCGSAITLRSLIPLTLDEGYARYAAWRLRLPLDLVSVGSRPLEEEVAWALDLQDEPLAVLSFFPLALLIRQAKNYGKILLTGDGADEVFLGYGRPADWTDGKFNGTTDLTAYPQLAVGPDLPRWMSPWGSFTAGHSLLGHMFVKLDRASAEQGVEARCPLLDWDLIAFVRSLPPEQVFLTNRSKALLKEQLADWPRWFVDRRKLGFPYRLRWLWRMRGFRGLREMIRPEQIEPFRAYLPDELMKRPHNWSNRQIFRNFTTVWKLLTWSKFLDRLRMAERLANESALHAPRTRAGLNGSFVA
jgi:asparagine synthetase B (glutamine-hydrolysing)